MNKELLSERSLLLDCIRLLKNFKTNEHTEDNVLLVSKILEINNLSDTTKLSRAVSLLVDNDDDDYALDEVDELINETILDLEFLVQQKYNKI